MPISNGSAYKTIGILVLWSASYFDKSIQNFLDLLFNVDDSALAILIKNNHSLPDIHAKGSVVLNGSNSYAEFSGWQEGMEEIRRLKLQPKQVIFANDTFCNHHPWNCFQKKIYSDTFKMQKKSDSPSIAGWKSSSKLPFIFEGVEMDSWISTFLFSLNDFALSAIRWEICPNQDWVSQYVLGGINEDRFFSLKMDSRLVQHLSAWLFNPVTKPHWYKAEQLNELNTERMFQKASAILREKKLTADSISLNIKFLYYQNSPLYFTALIALRARSLAMLIIEIVARIKAL